MSRETYLISHPRVVFFLIPSSKSMRIKSGNKEGKTFRHKIDEKAGRDSWGCNKRSDKKQPREVDQKNSSTMLSPQAHYLYKPYTPFLSRVIPETRGNTFLDKNQNTII